MHKGSPILAVCMFLLFLLLTPVSPQCRTGTAIECKRSAEFVPGLYLAEWGIDITELYSTHYNVMDLKNDWQKSDGSCTLCENPLLEDKQLHRLPLAITDWKANISCQEKVQHSIPQSVISAAEEMTELIVKNDWKKELDVEVNSSNNVQWILAGSDSILTSFIEEKRSQDMYIFLLHHVSCSYYKFSINKDKSVSENFKNKVKVLPEKYDRSSKLKYRHLIRTYGTHFITELDLGVHVRILTALPVCRMLLEGFTASEISRCLEIEVGKIIGFDKVTKNPDFQKCKEKLGKLYGYWLSWEQLRYIEGGEASLRSQFLDNGFMTDPKEWLESVKSQPSLLSYSLEPLHTLVDKGDPQREGLRQALSEYVRERALWRNCTHSCPPGVQHGAWDSCSCECPTNNFTNSMCCSQQRGLAKLTVTIESARGLLGDFFSRSDTYVKISFQEKKMCTSTIWNNNNPKWNVNFDFGIIEKTGYLEVEVWDQDFGWDDDLLGTCLIYMKAWESSEHVCFLNHGLLHYKHDLACGPHLGGPYCEDYVPLGAKQE